MKKLIFILTIIFVFTGCSDRFNNIENILEPPRFSKQNYQIYSALESSVGKNIKLHYPKSGSNRSSFVFYNLDDEPTDEAIVFYTSYKKGSSVNTEIRINILDYIEGKWVSIYDMPSGSSRVDKVTFLNKNDHKFMVIGFNVLNQSDKIFKVYRLNNKRLEEIFSQIYDSFEVINIDSNNNHDIFFVSRESYELNSVDTYSAKLLVYDGSSFNVVSQVSLERANYSESVIEYGMFDNNKKGVFLDSSSLDYKSSDLISTQLIYIDENKNMKNLFYNPEDNLNIYTMRNNNIFSKDIDSDGIIEVPVQRLMKGYDHEYLNASIDPVYIIDWNKYNYKSKSLETFYSSYVSTSDGYNFILPNNWVNKVTAKKVIENNEVVFYKLEDNVQNSNQEILRIRAVSKNSLGDLSAYHDYVELTSSGQIVYMVKISEDADPNLRIKLSQLKGLFKLYI